MEVVFFTFLGRLLFFSLYICVHDYLEVFLGFIKARPPSLYDFECTTTKSSSSRVSQWCNFEFYSPCRKHHMVSRHGDVSWKVVFVANLILFPAANDPIDLLDRIAGSAGRWGDSYVPGPTAVAFHHSDIILLSQWLQLRFYVDSISISIRLVCLSIDYDLTATRPH